jgi:hypothetical protein
MAQRYFSDGAFHDVPDGVPLPDDAMLVTALPLDSEGQPFLDVSGASAAGEWVGSDGSVLTRADAEQRAEAMYETSLLAKIDREAGEYRQNFITTVPGQEMTYLEKERQARAWLADAAPDPENAAYDMLRAEADALGVTVAERVPVIIAQADAWRWLGSKIEGQRMGAKAAVSAAVAREDKEAAASVNWAALLA